MLKDAEFMKNIRREERLSQIALAKRLGFSQNAISYAERGRNGISRRMLDALQREFPQYFQQEEQPKSPAWNPATIAFAVRVITECGWLEQHDKAIRTKPAQKTVSPDPWVYMSDRMPDEPGRYYVAGYKRNGLPYKGVLVLYADGKWYTTNGNPMHPPEKWQALKSFTETERY